MQTQTQSEIQHIALRAIRVSPTNPRRHLTADSVAELVESVKQHGVLQPILVRTVDLVGDSEFELVCGHRRYAAALVAEIPFIPAVIRELTDVQALELQVTENLQREDLHPLEEAEGYRQLTEHGYSVKELAAKLGKSAAYVYGRLELTKLSDAAKELCWKGAMHVSLALLVARIPDQKLQEQAAEKILKGRWTGPNEFAPLTLREAQELVQDEFMLDMKSAPFDILDAQLVPVAGPCSTCPKRTGNVPDLFGDVGKEKDLCTDPVCFRGKVAADWARTSAPAAERGAKVLTLEQSERVLPPHYHGQISMTSGYVRPSDKPDGGDQSYRQLAKAAGEEPTEYVVRNGKDGKAVTVWKRKEVAALGGRKGAKDGAKPTAQANQPPLEQTYEFRNALRERLVPLVVKQIETRVGSLRDDEFMRALVVAIEPDFVSELELPKGTKLSKLTGKELRTVVARCVFDPWQLTSEAVTRAFGVNLKELEKAARVETRAAFKAKADAAAKPAAEKPAAAQPAKSKPAKKGGRK